MHVHQNKIFVYCIMSASYGYDSDPEVFVSKLSVEDQKADQAEADEQKRLRALEIAREKKIEKEAKENAAREAREETTRRAQAAANNSGSEDEFDNTGFIKYGGNKKYKKRATKKRNRKYKKRATKKRNRKYKRKSNKRL
jgi:hypothetical protein